MAKDEVRPVIVQGVEDAQLREAAFQLVLNQERNRWKDQEDCIFAALVAVRDKAEGVLAAVDDRLSEDGCDCGTDEPGTCVWCRVRAYRAGYRR